MREYNLSMSVGIARYDPPFIDEFIARADASMYRHKKEVKEKTVAHRFPKEVAFEKSDLASANLRTGETEEGIDDTPCLRRVTNTHAEKRVPRTIPVPLSQ
jgi:hypothetical protein